MDPSLSALDRLGVCPQESPSLLLAALGGLGPGYEDEGAELLAQVEYRRRLFVLVTIADPAGPILMGVDPASGTRPHEEVIPVNLWLMEVSRREEGAVTFFRRTKGVRLYEHFVGNDAAANVMSDDGCDAMASELRARDLDGDGEVELTVIAAGADQPNMNRQNVIAFLVGADDFDTQARFSRCHHWDLFDASGEHEMTDETAWVLRDVDGDGRADLHVAERWRSRDEFDGDSIGDGESARGYRERAGERREVDCLYDVATDRWVCPLADGVALGGRLFDPSAPRGTPPWTPTPPAVP